MLSWRAECCYIIPRPQGPLSLDTWNLLMLLKQCDLGPCLIIALLVWALQVSGSGLGMQTLALACSSLEAPVDCGWTQTLSLVLCDQNARSPFVWDSHLHYFTGGFKLGWWLEQRPCSASWSESWTCSSLRTQPKVHHFSLPWDATPRHRCPPEFTLGLGQVCHWAPVPEQGWVPFLLRDTASVLLHFWHVAICLDRSCPQYPENSLSPYTNLN